MSSITKNRIGRYTYLYESTSYWNSNSKYPDNKKKSVGMIDPYTGDTYYKQEYSGHAGFNIKLLTGLEPVTSSLPRTRSTY